MEGFSEREERWSFRVMWFPKDCAFAGNGSCVKIPGTAMVTECNTKAYERDSQLFRTRAPNEHHGRHCQNRFEAIVSIIKVWCDQTEGVLHGPATARASMILLQESTLVGANIRRKARLLHNAYIGLLK